jgi:transposase-like protein
MPKRRRYSNEQVASALAYAETAPSILAAAQDLDVPERTLNTWINGHVQAMPTIAEIANAKHNLATKLMTTADKAINLVNERIDKKTISDGALAGIIGSSIDKAQLLRGDATSITQTTHITEEQAKQETAQLLSEAIAIYASMTDEQRAVLLREQSAPVDVIEGCDRSNAEHADVEQATE